MEIEETHEDRVILHVTDTGRGIPKERQDSLFESFNRLDADETGVEGTGIGLNITKNLIELMAGSISVESVVGEGSRFTVELPKGANTEDSEEKMVVTPTLKKANPDRGPRHTLLYVEDNHANMTLVQKILSEREEVQLLTAPDAKLGISLAKSHLPDLILMDINLPGMDGITAMVHLRANKQTRNIPILAVSAHALKSEVGNAMESGFDSYITKPIMVEAFLETIDHYLNKVSPIAHQKIT